MARKKSRPPIPDELEVVVAVWKDASGHSREMFTPELLTNTTVGLLVFENDEMIALAHELSDEDEDQGWMLGDGMEFTKIPKALITKREVVGKYKTGTSNE